MHPECIVKALGSDQEAVRNASVQCNVNWNGSLATLKDQLVNSALCRWSNKAPKCS